MSEIINLAPHEVNVGDIGIPASGTVARVSVQYNPIGEFDGIPLVEGSYGEVTDLPEQKEGVLLIVSTPVRIALPERSDLASPAELIRDDKGVIIGCNSLEVNRI